VLTDNLFQPGNFPFRPVGNQKFRASATRVNGENAAKTHEIGKKDRPQNFPVTLSTKAHGP
jgi:hypothetical protein